MLTDAQINKIASETVFTWGDLDTNVLDFAHAIEEAVLEEMQVFNDDFIDPE